MDIYDSIYFLLIGTLDDFIVIEICLDENKLIIMPTSSSNILVIYLIVTEKFSLEIYIVIET